VDQAGGAGPEREAPDLSESLIERLVAGTEAQADGRSIRELERYRDESLIAIMKAIEETRKAHA
jgi:carnitine 3-dehydrogenase